MSKTSQIMRRYNLMLNKLIALHITACGYEENIAEANKQRMKVENFLRNEFDSLTKDNLKTGGGVP